MNNSSAKKNILEKIARALTTPSESLTPEITDRDFFKKGKGNLLERFSSEFTAIDGNLEFCREHHTLQKRLREIRDQFGWEEIYFSKTSLAMDIGLDDLPFVSNTASDSAPAVITGCEYLIARTGTIVLSAAQDYGRALTVYAPVHIVVASVDQIVDDIGNGIEGLLGKYLGGLPSAFFFASGPSRTGDIEKTLVKGVHGPTQVYLFLLGSRSIPAGQTDYQSKL